MTRRPLIWAAWIVAAVLALAVVRIAVAFLAPRVKKPRPAVATHGGDVYGDPIPQGATARLGTIRFRGKGPAIWAPDGEHLLVAGWDERVLAMNAKTGLVDWTLPGHSTPFMRRLDVTDFEEWGRVLHRGRLPIEDDELDGLLRLPDGRLLTTGASLRIWDLGKRVEVKCIPLRGGPAWNGAVSPDGKLVAFPYGQSVRIVDLEAGRGRGRRKAGAENVGVTCVAWSGDGGRVFAGRTDGRVAVLAVEGGPPIALPVSDVAIDAMLVADEGRALWTLDHKGALTIRSLASSDVPSRRIELGDGKPPTPPWRGGWLSPSAADGRVVCASFGKRVEWFDAATGEVERRADRRVCLTWTSHAMRIVGPDAPPQPETICGRVAAAAWSSDGRRIATVSYGGWNGSEVCAWDAATGRRDWTFDLGPNWWSADVAWSADGGEIVASTQGRIVGLDAKTGAERWKRDVVGKAASPSIDERGARAAWTDDDRVVHVADPRGGDEIAAVRLISKPDREPPKVVVLPNDDVVVVEMVPIQVEANGSWQGKDRLRVWRPGAADAATELDVPGTNVLAASRDGRFVAVGSWACAVIDLGSSPPRKVGLAQYPNEEGVESWRPFTAAALSSDGALLALGDETGAVRVFSVPALTPTKTFLGHQSQIFALAFSPDGARLVSGSEDATALVWDL